MADGLIIFSGKVKVLLKALNANLYLAEIINPPHFFPPSLIQPKIRCWSTILLWERSLRLIRSQFIMKVASFLVEASPVISTPFYFRHHIFLTFFPPFLPLGPRARRPLLFPSLFLGKLTNILLLLSVTHLPYLLLLVATQVSGDRSQRNSSLRTTVSQMPISHA